MGTVEARELDIDALTAKALARYRCPVRERRRRETRGAGNVKRPERYSLIGIGVASAEGQGLCMREITYREILSLAEH